MNLDEEEQAIYGQLNGKQQKELGDLHGSTEFWQRLPKIAAAGIACLIVLAYIF